MESILIGISIYINIQSFSSQSIFIYILKWKHQKLNVNIMEKPIGRRLFVENFCFRKTVNIICLILSGKSHFNVWNIHHYLCSLLNVHVSYFCGCFLSLKNTTPKQNIFKYILYHHLLKLHCYFSKE